MSFVLRLLAPSAVAIDYTDGNTWRNLRIAVSKSARILRLLGWSLYRVDPATGAATLIGPTGMPAVTVAPFSQNPDGTFNVYSENLVSAHGRLYANFATATTDFVTVTPVIPGALYQIDPSTGRATWIAPTDTNITAMVNLNDTVYAFDVYTNQVLTLDLTTGQTTPVSDVDPAVMSLIAGATPARPYPAAGR